jgi:rhodanese-related sulfurtransferase
MKTVIVILILAATGIYFLLPEKNELTPKEFSEALQSKGNKILIDLRSDYDFSKGHIPGASNIDPNWGTYEWRIAELDTDQDVFIYCQNGEQSKKSAAYLKTQGFNSVTMLKGGLKQWTKEEYILTPEELIPPPELTFKDFNRLLELEHLVIVEFYLPGDRNCRDMGAILDELALSYEGAVKILRINIDNYKYLAIEMEIEFTPTLQFYENGNLCGTLEGVIEIDHIKNTFHLKEYSTLANQ